MSSTSEGGHPRNVANFGKLISECTGYSAGYNPSNPDISLESMRTLLTGSQGTLDSLNSGIPAYNNAIAARELAFKPLSKLITRVINALKATSAPDEIISKVVTLVRKLQGRRASAKLTEEEKQELIAQGKEVNEISSSQLSFDNRLNNLDQFIKLLASIPEYSPNETELQVTTLTAMLEDLKQKNNAAVEAASPVNLARIARNDILYRENTGLVDVALSAKRYVKSVYGASSPEYRLISGLVFKRYKA